MNGLRVVCVLSGGGAKAAAQVGALRALEERRCSPRHFVGTSMGAVVAALFAAGRSSAEVLDSLTSISRTDVASLSPTIVLGPFAKSLLRPGPFRETLARLMPLTRFDDFPTPLTITAVDAESGELVLFGAGGRSDAPLVDALYASCALPGYFPPGVIGSREYIDGGMRSVLPLDVAGRFEPAMVFAVRTGPSFAAEPAPRPARLPPLVRAYGNAMRILMAAQTDAEIARWQQGPVPLVLVEPPVRREATFALDELARYEEDGYRTAVQALDAWAAGA